MQIYVSTSCECLNLFSAYLCQFRFVINQWVELMGTRERMGYWGIDEGMGLL